MRQLAGVVYGSGNRAEAAALMNDAETVHELAELFKTALESSADLQYELLEETGRAITEKETGGAKDKKFSIVALENGATFVKAEGDKVIRGNDPNVWASQIEDYILSIVDDRGRLDIPTADGSVLTITGYGTRESHTTAGELSNFNDYYDEYGRFDRKSARVRAQASLYIDEVVKISRDEGRRAVTDRRGEHGEIAVNGWKYRNVHFMDTDGSYYQITLGVPQAIGGRQTAYSLGNVRRRRSPIDPAFPFRALPRMELLSQTVYAARRKKAIPWAKIPGSFFMMTLRLPGTGGGIPGAARRRPGNGRPPRRTACGFRQGRTGKMRS